LLVGLGCPAAKDPHDQMVAAGSSGSASGPQISGSANVGDDVRFREKRPDGLASASASVRTKGEEPDPDDAAFVLTPPPSGSEGRCGAGKVNPKGTCDCPPGFSAVGKPGDARCVARAASASASTSASAKPSGTGGVGRCPRGSEICE
jgi:hypothetical protein